jgi:hypothetical protein
LIQHGIASLNQTGIGFIFKFTPFLFDVLSCCTLPPVSG